MVAACFLGVLLCFLCGVLCFLGAVWGFALCWVLFVGGVCFACWIAVVSGVVICRYYFCFVFCTCGVCVVWCLFVYVYLAFGLGAPIRLPFVGGVCGGCSPFLLAGLWVFLCGISVFPGGLLFSPLIWVGLWVFLVFFV